jgi:hypothetical protein
MGLSLNFLDRIALRQWLTFADMPIHASIPVSVPGGTLGRTASLATLKAAQTAMDLAGPALDRVSASHSGWNSEVLKRYGSSVFFTEAHYTLQFKDGQLAKLSQSGLAFRIAKDRLMTTGEMSRPWEFDSDVALLLQTKEAVLVADSYDLTVWPASGSGKTNSRSYSSGTLKIEKPGGKSETVFMPRGTGKTRVTLAKRASEANTTVVSLVDPADWIQDMPPAPGATGQTWEKLAVFRQSTEGRLELIVVAGQRIEGRLQFDTPVDQSVFGSPVIAPEGLIGIVQEERSALPVSF